MKSWDSTDAHDLNEKTRLAGILREHFNLRCVFDRVIFVDKETFTFTDQHPKGCLTKQEVWRDYEVFCPDILIKKPKPIIIEIDGDFHFNTSKGVKQTNKRNEFYEYMGVRFAWFHTKALNEMNDKEIIEYLRTKI